MYQNVTYYKVAYKKKNKQTMGQKMVFNDFFKENFSNDFL